jgi:hypothetical protein
MPETLHGHSIHFLERLSRASGEASDLALEIYHEPKILRFALERIRIPEGRDRVAVSLDPEDRGPFLVATSEGAFVTCLGRDMTSADLHVVPHGQLMAHRRDWLENQKRLRLREEIREADRRFDHFLGEIIERGNQISREEFVAASALQIALKNDYAYYHIEFQNTALKLLHLLMRSKALRKEKDGRLRSFWEMHWSLGNLALLATMDGARDFNEDYIKALSQSLLNMFRWGDSSICMRALWGLARMGKAALPHCRERLKTATVEMDGIGAALGIAAIGMRHKKLEAEALRILKSPGAPESRVGNAAAYYEVVGAKVLDFVRDMIASPEKLDAAYLMEAKWVAFQISKQVAAGTQYDFASEESIPEDLARSVMAAGEFDVRLEKNSVFHLAAPACWLAKCEAHDLYPPGTWVDLLRGRWTRDQTFTLVEQARSYWGKAEPIVAEKRPGRNDPCPCGSGKKYKKCCLGAS